MKIKTLYNQNEEITLKSYLNKYGIIDIDEYMCPQGKYLDNCLSYNNIEEAVKIFRKHYLQNSPTYILCDSGDCDGITSTCILYKYMKLLNPHWNIKILLHKNKERGLADEILYNQILNHPRPFIIIPDAGSNDKEEVENLKKIDISCLIIDHHPITSPIEKGVLISNQIGNVDKNGSGCLVTHKFLQALDLKFNLNYSKQFVDMTALSIISDTMDITSMQNRTYLYYGLFKDSPLIKNKFLKALINRFIDKDVFTIRDIAFKISPKINSVCRCGNQDTKKKLILAFLGKEDIENSLEMCEECHKQQIENVSNFIKHNKDRIDDSNNLIVLASNDLLPSYSGLIAGRISEEYGKPTIVGKIKEGKLLGSLRSPIPLATEINKTGLAIMKGHGNACGAEIKEENIPKLVKFINSIDIETSSEIEVLQSYNSKDIPKHIFKEFCNLNIWDTRYLLKPLFHIKNIKIKSNQIKLIGKKENIFKFEIDNIEFIRFKATKQIIEDLHLNKNTTLEIEIIGELNINIWNYKKTLQIIINDIEIKKYKQKVEEVF